MLPCRKITANINSDNTQVNIKKTSLAAPKEPITSVMNNGANKMMLLSYFQSSDFNLKYKRNSLVAIRHSVIIATYSTIVQIISILLFSRKTDIVP